jgi:tRNA threonylcarbamoyladenosine biosynthesis protein TsaE
MVALQKFYSQKSYRICSPEEMENLGSRLAVFCLMYPLVILLEGDLGAGKTTFTRGFLKGLGYQGTVKSPTFSLLETYELKPYTVTHFDLYRLKAVNELDGIGWTDFFDGQQTCLIEWPERAEGLLKTHDINCIFRIIEEGRQVELQANSRVGEAILQKMVNMPDGFEI